MVRGRAAGWAWAGRLLQQLSQREAGAGGASAGPGTAGAGQRHRAREESRRAQAETRELLLPGVNYFQVVFTLPDRFSPLILGNRRELYDLLFRSAWQSLDEELRQEGKFHPAALMVLHT